MNPLSPRRKEGVVGSVGVMAGSGSSNEVPWLSPPRLGPQLDALTGLPMMLPYLVNPGGS